MLRIGLRRYRDALGKNNQRLGRLTLAVCVELSGTRANSAAGAVGRAKALRYDAFEAELARMAYDFTVDDAGARARRELVSP